MRKEVIVILTLALVVGLCWGAGAQIVPENHYLVYQLAEQFTLPISVTLNDQFDQFFGDFSTPGLILDKFANPVEKNNEPYFNHLIHQTWWLIDDPQGIKQVHLLNQFGDQNWDVGHGRYLVLPAWKNQIPPGMNEFPTWNHYKCYEAVGPAVNVPVILEDQWNGFGSVAVDPVLFCNPCIKELASGERYEIEAPESHLAVYRLEPTLQNFVTAAAFDQFGDWGIIPIEAIWLVVPTEKLNVVDNETKPWGSIKSLYR